MTKTTRKIGILIVYFLADSDLELLDIHLQFIQKFSASENYQIYAVANRVSQRLIAQLKKVERIRLLDMFQSNLTGSREHSFYLDQLTSYAVADGCTHLVTLDCDAFPITENWLDTICRCVTQAAPVVAVSREENGDSFLPHPSLTCFSADFYKKNKFSFYPEDSIIESVQFKSFLRDTRQYADSGIGLAYILYKDHIQYVKLSRSNKRNDHYLLGGIYGDVVFHLGSMGWGAKEFRLDRSRSMRVRLGVYIRNHVVHCPPGSLRRIMLDVIELPALKKIRHRNNVAYSRIRAKLADNPEAYIRYLLGSS